MQEQKFINMLQTIRNIMKHVLHIGGDHLPKKLCFFGKSPKGGSFQTKKDSLQIYIN